MEYKLETSFGEFKGIKKDSHLEFLGIPYATSKRFSYSKEIEKYEKEVDATKFGPACPQYRQFFPHLDVPERKFYYREFREGLEFEYDEDKCLNLNIYTPLEKGNYPVLVFVHGGGFNSMCNSESYLAGEGYTKRGIILVVINYRVGVFGYLTNEAIKNEFGRDGNFGLDDILVSFKWVKHHIADFGGDPNNITVMGQSAGAINIQYLCLTKKSEGLFNRVIMMSGAGAFPKFALPKESNLTHDYWNEVIKASGKETFEEFKNLSVKEVLSAVEVIKAQRKDNQTNTMPVVDGYLLEDHVDKLIKNPAKLDYLCGYTNNDMFTIVVANMANKYIKSNNGYLYYFDVDAPGDDNQAFHSSDLRYVFGTLDKSWRPYDEEDKKISEIMMDYFANFIKTGDPNAENLPHWERRKVALAISKQRIGMRKPPKLKLLKNTLKGDPK
ncbi:MAG: carboxylesterase family protein [Bacilli bacterium]|nr:carboxylesterase family protein [Bacilli bacterium]